METITAIRPVSKEVGLRFEHAIIRNVKGGDITARFLDEDGKEMAEGVSMEMLDHVSSPEQLVGKEIEILCEVSDNHPRKCYGARGLGGEVIANAIDKQENEYNRFNRKRVEDILYHKIESKIDEAFIYSIRDIRSSLGK